MSKANREHKASLFTSYFSDKRRLIEAYNAIAGTDYPPTAKVEFKTLENVLHSDRENDIAFLIEDRFIVLIEHQSTINPNMATRILFYITEVLKGIIPRRSLYEGKLIKIPIPEFFVIYNGKAKYPEKTILKISDAFMAKQESPALELTVSVYNISKGHNKELLERCRALSDYSVFIDLIYEEQERGESLEKAIDNTIHYCIGNDIMLVYLQEQSDEVKRMLITEWDEEEYHKVIKEEALEDGREEGKSQATHEIGQRMKKEGIPVDVIVRITGLETEEIAGL